MLFRSPVDVPPPEPMVLDSNPSDELSDISDTEFLMLEDSEDVVPAPLDVRPPVLFPEASSPDLTIRITIPNSPRKSKHHRRHQNRKRNLRIKNEIRVGLGFRPAPYRVPSHLKSHFSTGSES